MQDTFLRMLVLALGLLTYPRHDPGVEEWDDISTVDMQKHAEKLLREGDRQDHKMAPVTEEMTSADKKEHRDDIENIINEQHESDQHPEKDPMSVSKQVSEEVSSDHKLPEGGNFMENVDPKLPQNFKSEPSTAQKTSQTDNEGRGNLQLDLKSKQGEDILTGGSLRDTNRLQEHQEEPEEKKVYIAKEQESLLQQLHTKTSENETEKAISSWEVDYLWYMWNIFSIISMIRFFRKYLGTNSQMKQGTRVLPMTCTAAEVPLPDSDTLQRFHSKYIRVSSDKTQRTEEFLEGFVNDLLDAMRTICDKSDGMVIEDFQMVDACDIIVPFSPPDPYSFQCVLCNDQASDMLPDTEICGQVKLVENKVQNGCHCQSPDADDMVCLLHCEAEKAEEKVTDAYDGLLCMKNSPYLSKSQVTKWFQTTVKQAWALISHKYNFELNIRYIDAPGALAVRFRSGKIIGFNMNPVVKFNTNSHFFIAPWFPNNFDTFWTLSLINYEDLFLEHICKHLPVNSCHKQTLEIAHFLHNRQAALSGCSALQDFHFKTALMHLLLAKDPSEWKPNNVACRLRDLLTLVEKSLEKKLMHHVLIGNASSQRVIKLPAELTEAKTMNLFQPLVVHNCIYRNAVTLFQEMLKNAHMLIHDYVGPCNDLDNCY